MAGNTSFSTLITTTLQNLPGDVFDAVVTNNALLNVLKKAGNIKIVSGGRQFTHPVFHRANSTFAARGRLDTVDLSLQDNLTRAVYDIKIIDGAVVLSDLDVAMNAGDKEKLIDLAEELKTEAEVSMSEIMGDQIFNTSAGANDLDGIPRLINTVPTSQSDVGGIDSSGSAQAYWRNYVYTTAVAAFGTTQAGLNAMSTTLNSTTYGRQGPTVIITTKAIYTLYELALTANVRYTQMETGEGTFRNLMFNTLPVYFDDNAPANRMYFIDTNSLRLQVLSQGNMKATKFMHTQDQLTESMLMYIFCNLTLGSRRTQGVISSITG